jgi:hypothetical protein
MLAGCSGSSSGASGGATSAGSGTGSASAGAASGGTTPSADPTANGAVAAGIDPANPGTPVASAVLPAPMQQDPKATLKLDILGLKRKDKLLVMTAIITPTNTLAEPQLLYYLLDTHSWRPALIDSTNLKLYSPVRSASSGVLITNVTSVRAAAGSPLFLYAVFSAPPPEITKINVQFQDTMPLLNDVPVQ